jgi:hypothetical protein
MPSNHELITIVLVLLVIICTVDLVRRLTR